MTQEEALDILKTGANVFLTGEPGSGKTHTINTFVAYLRAQGIEPAITASTGIAATHVGGMTIHSWSGIGVKSIITDYDLEFIAQKEKVVRRVTRAKVLIIDEISMLSRETLDSVELVCRTLRNSARAFGGLQIIFVGDFFQLPPVVKSVAPRQKSLEIDYDDDANAAPFAFRSRAWKASKLLVCYLSEQHRQEDPLFLETLSAVRRGEITERVHATLRARAVSPKTKVVTKLYPHNANVDRLNDSELTRLAGAAKTFHMQARGAPPLIEGLKRNCLSPEHLFLKVGAKVMFTKNSLDGEYVNGTTGEVVSFAKMSGLPTVKTLDGQMIEADTDEWKIQDGAKVLASIEQLPLRLAWAITVHKSQGMSLDAAVIDLSQAFEYGQGYVALSRVRTLGGLYLTGYNERALAVHPEVAEQDEGFRAASDAAQSAFANMPKQELADMHANFIKKTK
jgi:ATP-dependent DNA helicase PIF1